ncbi:hypothetical protein TruAng_011034 [Truncatella angustata]|nr:hypothetical protein TruAng_011034 [Truncatella angustata]
MRTDDQPQDSLNPLAPSFDPRSGVGSEASWTDYTNFDILSNYYYPLGLPRPAPEGPNFVLPHFPPSPPVPRVKTWHASAALHCWPHLAAVKAIAFCPWRPHLLATGGGSNDKMIHFYHSTSGTTLATISVSAQVTSLVWSTTRREIAATFGYAQPDHAIRIAVFSWPDCQMVASVKWDGEHRALYAVPYPGNLSPTSHTQSDNSESRAHRQRQSSRGLRDRRSRKGKGGMAEGCLIVAASDKSVKFHEIWGARRRRSTAGWEPGIMGGSDIIEMTEGIDKEGDIIR